MTERAKINSAIASLMRADGPNIALDWEIHLSRGIEGVGLYGRHPAYTASIDAALRLVPEGWFWRVGHTLLYRAWAGCYRTHPDHGEPGRNEFNWHRGHWEQLKTTPAMALCIVALEAQRSLIREPQPL